MFCCYFGNFCGFWQCWLSLCRPVLYQYLVCSVYRPTCGEKATIGLGEFAVISAKLTHGQLR